MRYYDPFETRGSGRYPKNMPMVEKFDFVFPDEMMGQGMALPGLAESTHAFGQEAKTGKLTPLMIGALGIGAIWLILKIKGK